MAKKVEKEEVRAEESQEPINSVEPTVVGEVQAEPENKEEKKRVSLAEAQKAAVALGTTPVSNKRGVKEQSNPGGDRFTSKEADFTSVEAPLDIYPETGIFAKPDAVRGFGAHEEDPEVLDRPLTGRDMEALVRSAMSHDEVKTAVRIIAKNGVISQEPDELVDIQGATWTDPLAPPPEP